MAVYVMSQSSSPNNPSYGHIYNSVLHRQSFSQIDDFLNQLKDKSSNKISIVEQLSAYLQVDNAPTWLSGMLDQEAKLLDILLNLVKEPQIIELRIRTIHLLNQVMHILSVTNFDSHMSSVLTSIIPLMGDVNPSIRSASTHCVHTCMKLTNDFGYLIHQLVYHGVENSDPIRQKNCSISLSLLLTPEFADKDFHELVQCLAKKLLAREEAVCEAALLSLNKIRNIVGDNVFNCYLNRLSAPLRKYYCRISERDFELETVLYKQSSPSKPANSRSPRESISRTNEISHSLNYNEQTDLNEQQKSRIPVGTSSNNWTGHFGKNLGQPINSHVFGIIPNSLMDQLDEAEDYRTRSQAIDNLRKIVSSLDSLHPLSDHLSSFIIFLNSLLEDSNFKIVTVSLEILTILITKFGSVMSPHQKEILLTISKLLGDGKVVVRQGVMKLIVFMMQILTPNAILYEICKNLTSRNSRVRQETLNLVIAALLTFPSVDFDLPFLCRTLCPCLTDPKRQVRHTCLECLAVLAQSLGHSRLSCLMQTVQSLDMTTEGKGVLKAVQTRLSRRQLPKIGQDGLVEYALAMPSSANIAQRSIQTGNPEVQSDEEWVLAGATVGGTSPLKPRSVVSDDPSDQRSLSPIIVPESNDKIQEDTINDPSQRKASERQVGYYSRQAAVNEGVISDTIVSRNGVPIPIKPSLIRSARKRPTRGQTVPLITTSDESNVEGAGDAGPVQGDSEKISGGSLSGIKSSATKKKAIKVFEDAEKRTTKPVMEISSRLSVPQSDPNYEDRSRDNPESTPTSFLHDSADYNSNVNQSDNNLSEKPILTGAARPFAKRLHQRRSAPCKLDLKSFITSDDGENRGDTACIEKDTNATYMSPDDRPIRGAPNNSWTSAIRADRSPRPYHHDDREDYPDYENSHLMIPKARSFQDNIASLKKREVDKRIQEERDKQREVLRRISYEKPNNEAQKDAEFDLSKDTRRPKPNSAGDPTMVHKANIKGRGTTYSTPGSSHHSKSHYDDYSRSAPAQNVRPEKALTQAINSLESSDWQDKNDALLSIQSLVQTAPETITGPEMHHLMLSIGQECKNLRSQVSRLAIQTVAECFIHLKRKMDCECDHLARVLLNKQGESSGFIREDVDKALEALITNISPNRVVLALVPAASHKNPAVRKSCAQQLAAFVLIMGSNKVLSGMKDFTDKILITAAQFSTDGSPDTRYYGRKIIFQLMSHLDFEPMCSKFIPENMNRTLRDVIENLKQKGLGEPPTSSGSAGSRRSGSMHRNGSSGSLADSPTHAAKVSPQKPRSKPPPVTDLATNEEMKALANRLSSTDWKERHEAIYDLVNWCQSSPKVVFSHSVIIFDKFVPRMQDSNSKVKLYALQSLQQILPIVNNCLLPVLTQIVQHTAQNLASKNQEMVQLASQLLDDFIAHIDCTPLLQAYVQTVSASNSRTKPDMIIKLSKLVDVVSVNKPKQVLLHVVPETCRLLLSLCGSGSNSGPNTKEIREATMKLVGVLYFHLGEDLVNVAKQNINATPKMNQLLGEMIDSI